MTQFTYDQLNLPQIMIYIQNQRQSTEIQKNTILKHYFLCVSIYSAYKFIKSLLNQQNLSRIAKNMYSEYSPGLSDSYMTEQKHDYSFSELHEECSVSEEKQIIISYDLNDHQSSKSSEIDLNQVSKDHVTQQTQRKSQKVQKFGEILQFVHPHYINNRRKGKEKRKSQIIDRKAKCMDKMNKNQTQWSKANNEKTPSNTKNLLGFGMKHHLDFIKKYRQGRQYIQQNEWIQQIYCDKDFNDQSLQKMSKKCVRLKHFNLLYQNPQVRKCLDKFFRNKILYRQLMLSSRMKAPTRYKSVYNLDIFQQNFKISEFKTISETKVKIQNSKKTKKIEKWNIN